MFVMMNVHSCLLRPSDSLKQKLRTHPKTGFEAVLAASLAPYGTVAVSCAMHTQQVQSESKLTELEAGVQKNLVQYSIIANTAGPLSLQQGVEAAYYHSMRIARE